MRLLDSLNSLTDFLPPKESIRPNILPLQTKSRKQNPNSPSITTFPSCGPYYNVELISSPSLQDPIAAGLSDNSPSLKEPITISLLDSFPFATRSNRYVFLLESLLTFASRLE